MLNIYDVRTEYRENPIGIDAQEPRFSWKLRSDKQNVMQECYRIITASDPDFQTVLWDSGVVYSDDSVRVRYDGNRLHTFERVYWKVIVTAGGERAESEVAFFEMGLLKERDWEATWIEADTGTIDPDPYKPVIYLRKTFIVKPGLVWARACQTAHGLYDFWLNGTPGTKDRFNPGFTSYYTRLQYQVYDITELLTEGENVWAVLLGDGWWRGVTGGLYKNNFGYQTQFFGQLVLEYADGSREIVATDEGFMTSEGPILMSDMKFGEIYDAALELGEWQMPGYDASGWKKAVCSTGKWLDKKLLIPSRSVPVREKENFEPKAFEDKDGNLILDFGQNIAGYVISVFRDLKMGQTVSLIHSEEMVDGVFSLGNICTGLGDDTHYQQTDYTAAEDLEEVVYTPAFSIFGFQYVKIEGYSLSKIQPGDFRAVAVYSDMEETGDFRCSNPLINKLVSNSRWSQKGNFMDVPTDCPTRERSPWTGDSQVYAKTSTRFMNTYPFFEKWMMDVTAEQFANGMVGNSVPVTTSMHNAEEVERLIREGKTGFIIPGIFGPGWKSGSFDGSAGWGDTAVITPYMMYLCYGDKQILENQYETARRWVNYMINCAKDSNPDCLNNPEYHSMTNGVLDADYIFDTHFHFGEWLEPYSREAAPDHSEHVDVESTKNETNPLVATTYLYYSSTLLAEMANILGIQKDQEFYSKYAANVKRVYNKYFIQPDGMIQSDHQASYVRALQFGLCADKETERKVAEKLVKAVRDNGMKLNTGFLSTPFLLFQLLEHGYKDEAFAVLEQTEAPSWLHAVTLGATTILESWNGMDDHTASFNHYSYGAVCDFLFGAIAGIEPCLEQPGYKAFCITPVIGGTLTEAEAVFESMYGTILSSWKKEADHVNFHFEIPVNTTAYVTLPDGEKFTLGSGAYDYTV